MLGATDFVLATVGNLDNDDSAQREQAAFWMLGQLGVQNNYRRYVNLFVNGNRRARIYEDSQQPSGDVVDEWFPDDNEGDLHKIEDWFEFDNTGDNKQFNVDATLQRFTTTGGVKKQARYRWNWRKRAVEDSANAYANLFQLVDAMNASGSAYTQQVEALVDVDQWARVICLEHLVGNWDAYGTGRGKNMYTYKPRDGKWNLFAWDIDFVLGSGSDPSIEICSQG
jgi:spore coat protein CotH